jgi:hypothetical protein
MTDNQPKKWGMYLHSVANRTGYYSIYNTPDGREVAVSLVSYDKTFSFFDKIKERALKENEACEPVEVTDWIRTVQLTMPEPSVPNIEPINVAKLAYENERDAEFEAEMKNNQ